MLSSEYKAVAIEFNDDGQAVIRTGRFRHHPNKSTYLTEVQVVEEAGSVTVTGLKREFTFHRNFSDWAEDISDKIDEYKTYEEDFFLTNVAKVGRFARKILRRKQKEPQRLLRDGWYGKKESGHQITFVFHGNLIEKYNERTPDDKD